MQSIGETEILIEATIVGKVRVQKVSALAALHPRIGLVVGVDLNPIDGSLHSGKARPDEYWLTELRGNLYLSENGPSIGSVHWIGAHCEIRSQPYPSESQLQLACDLDPGTLERLETARGGNDLALWIELWPRIEHPGGYLSASIRGFRLAVARVEWLRFLEGVGYGTYELMELRIPKENAELTHRSIDGIREAQHRLWLGDHGGALAEARKVIEALESLAPEKKLEPLLSGYHAHQDPVCGQPDRRGLFRRGRPVRRSSCRFSCRRSDSGSTTFPPRRTSGNTGARRAILSTSFTSSR